MTDAKPPLWETTAHFIDRESGVMSRVDKVDESYAYISVLMALPSSWAMPVTQYDATWATRFVPIDMGQTKVPEKYRPPADTRAWVEPPAAPSEEGSRGETPEGVRISDDA